MIAEGRIQPGQKIPSETEIIAALGVSRSVVREAVSHMQAAGLVETFQGKGTFAVAGAPQQMGLDPGSVDSMHDVLALLELRIMLEAESAGLAASRHTEAQLAQVKATLAEFIECCRAGGPTAEADSAFHLAIARRDAESARAAMRTHLANSRERLRRAYEATQAGGSQD
jgi:DNA-binding FadR family transcriptional regulator